VGPYIKATRDGLPDGGEKMVFDRFHIVREMTKVVDTVRKHEHRGFLREGADSPLTGTRLFSDERRPDHYADAFTTLQALNLKAGRAWAAKEALHTLSTYRQGPPPRASSHGGTAGPCDLGSTR
jgi:transposase